MKRAIAALILLPLLSIPGWSSSIPCTESGSTTTDTITSEIVLPSTGGQATAIWEFLSTRNSSGQISYVIDATSIYFTGDGSVVDGMSTIQVFDMIAKATVGQGIALGYTACPTSCNSPVYVTVRQPACVTRTGSGLSTHFAQCQLTGCCVRQYSVCCPNGQSTPVITLVSSTSPNCQGGGPYCETTCP